MLHSLLSLSLSHCIHTPTLSLPLTYLISLEHEIRNVVFSFFFLHRRKRIRKVAVIAKGKFNERRRLSSRNPVLLSPSLPRRIFPKTVDQKNPFSLPFLFLFFSILTNKRISLISSCESQCIVFFLFFLKNQSIYGMIRHLTGLPCKALERRGLRIYAERHARRVQLFRYKFVHFLWNRQRRNVGWISAYCLASPVLVEEGEKEGEERTKTGRPSSGTTSRSCEPLEGEGGWWSRGKRVDRLFTLRCCRSQISLSLVY